VGTHVEWVGFTLISDRTLTLPMGGLYYPKPAPWGHDALYVQGLAIGPPTPKNTKLEGGIRITRPYQPESAKVE